MIKKRKKKKETCFQITLLENGFDNCKCLSDLSIAFKIIELFKNLARSSNVQVGIMDNAAAPVLELNFCKNELN